MCRIDGRLKDWERPGRRFPSSDPSVARLVLAETAAAYLEPGEEIVAVEGGKWKFVATNATKFPDDARRAVEGTRVVKPDALGKVKLG